MGSHIVNGHDETSKYSLNQKINRRRILLERLCLSIAMLERVSPRQVLTRVSLDWLAVNAPDLLNEPCRLKALRRVPGLGPRRIHRHGAEILACLESCEESP